MSKFEIESPKATEYKEDITLAKESMKIEDNNMVIDNSDFFFANTKESVNEEAFEDLTKETNRKIEALTIAAQEKAGQMFLDDEDLERVYMSFQLGSKDHKMTGSIDRCRKGTMKNKDGEDVPYESELAVSLSISNFASGRGMAGIKAAGKTAMRKALGKE